MSTSKAKAIWLVGGGHLQVPAIREIKRQGYFAVVSDKDEQCPAIHEDVCFVPASTYDASETAKAIPAVWRRYEIVGVMTCGADVAPTVSLVAEATGNKCIDLDTALLTHNKYHVRYTLERFGMSAFQPNWLHYSLDRYKTYNDPIGAMIQDIQERYRVWIDNEHASHVRDNGIVIKPLSKSGSRGVSVLTPADVGVDFYLRECIKQVFGYEREFLVEERLIGTEHSVELLLDNNIVIYQNIVDRPFTYTGGVAMEQGHVNPSNLPDASQIEMITMVAKAAEKLGVKWGPFKCDTIMTKFGPRILEATARLSGGFDCQYTTPIATGRNPIGALVQLCAGQAVSDEFIYHSEHGYAACHASFPSEGVVEAIQGDLFIEPTVKEIRAGRTLSLITCKVGDTISYRNCTDRAAFNIAHGPSYDVAWHHAKSAALNTTDRIFVRA
jgi:hypothetical protein